MTPDRSGPAPHERRALELTEAGFAVHRLYGLQGIGAHLQEEHLLAVMADPERWPLWRQAFLATYDRPDLIGVSSHVLAVGRRSDTP
jgi:hypothetical protein